MEGGPRRKKEPASNEIKSDVAKGTIYRNNKTGRNESVKGCKQPSFTAK